VASLKPGGLVVVEGFHRDSTKNSSIGGGVVFDTNELLKLFGELRVLHYEDANAVGDFGRRDTRVVRLAAQKRCRAPLVTRVGILSGRDSLCSPSGLSNRRGVCIALTVVLNEGE
jgi:hypothetical protein